jgi:hypothetical protein
MKMAGPLGALCCFQRSEPPARLLLRGIFEAKNAEDGFGAASRSVLGNVLVKRIPKCELWNLIRD